MVLYARWQTISLPYVSSFVTTPESGYNKAMLILPLFVVAGGFV